ncbi:hypothetical protein QBC37DRAFT_25779 [Rhypophila decipiens]|uniref:Uncharacterized protein n=1 Tax=Rhypophila decipiens TaxID=261697 RepID=A0AAN6YG29_9PEZI|nr:hypothetical protein QBC37DRAFT_25779 [Rhypophila decipiens]
MALGLVMASKLLSFARGVGHSQGWQQAKICIEVGLIIPVWFYENCASLSISLCEKHAGLSILRCPESFHVRPLELRLDRYLVLWPIGAVPWQISTPKYHCSAYRNFRC